MSNILPTSQASFKFKVGRPTIQEVLQKKCRKCNITKPINMFSKLTRSKDGIDTQCIDCYKAYRIVNKDNISKYMSIWYQNNKEDHCKKQCEYQKENKQKKAYYDYHYRDLNKEKLSKQKREYQKTLKCKASSKNKEHKRRSQKKQGNVTTEQILKLQNEAKYCYYCNEILKNKKVHIDHYQPLSKGGEHTLSNLVISCAQCNLKKNSKDPVIFANSIGKLL